MRRPALVGALVAAVIVFVASAAMALGSLGGSSTRPTGGLNQGQWGGMMGGQDQGQWGGMMGGQNQGQGMMGGSIMGGSIMGSMGMQWLPGDGVPVSSIPAARARATKAATPAGLHPGEVMWFDNGFYVELKDSAQKPATEVIVDPRTGSVSTEPGPAMMWNTRFGMRGEGSAGAVTETKAREIATSWLATNQAGTTVKGIDGYPGYFTLDLQRGGTVWGMMSVSSSTGTVWYHSWHGTFIAMED